MIKWWKCYKNKTMVEGSNQLIHNTHFNMTMVLFFETRYGVYHQEWAFCFTLRENIVYILLCLSLNYFCLITMPSSLQHKSSNHNSRFCVNEANLFLNEDKWWLSPQITSMGCISQGCSSQQLQTTLRKLYGRHIRPCAQIWHCCVTYIEGFVHRMWHMTGFQL